MRKSALILCVLGIICLIVGSAIASPSVQTAIHKWIVIPCSGTIGYKEPMGGLVPPPEGTGSAQLSQIGYLMILLGVGFFLVGLLVNRKKKVA